MKIHPSAIVDTDAEIADDVEIQAYSIIGPHVRIGAGTVVGPHCVIDGRTEIGEGNRFFSGAQIGVLSQDLKHRGDLIGRCAIGNNNMFREHCSISASTMTSEEDDHRVTSIGDSCLFMAYSHVAHDCRVGNSLILGNSSALAGHVTIEDHCTVSGLVGMHQDCVVGKMSFVGGMSRVTKDVPPYMIVEGNPVRCHGPNSVGLQRNGLDEATRNNIKKLYKIVYRSNLNTTQALHEIERSVDDCKERDHFLEFVRKSVRGIVG